MQLLPSIKVVLQRQQQGTWKMVVDALQYITGTVLDGYFCVPSKPILPQWTGGGDFLYATMAEIALITVPR